ncbi:hypothetical protein Tco_0426595, partial [Tanacetum coccineum]
NLLLLLLSAGVTMGGGGLNFSDSAGEDFFWRPIQGGRVNLLDPRPSLGWFWKSDLRSELCRLDWSCGFQWV